MIDYNDHRLSLREIAEAAAISYEHAQHFRWRITYEKDERALGAAFAHSSSLLIKSESANYDGEIPRTN